MFGGAVVRRAVLPIAAVLLFAAPALAQNEASAIVEKFAGDAEREKARKAEAARKAATEAKAKKDAERKAAYDKKVLEVRKDAEAQRAAAQARHRREEARRTEEGDVLTRARQETENAKATEEIRRLIEEAEAARIRAEDMLAQEASSAQGSVQPAQPANTKTVQDDVDRRQQDAVLRAREIEAERANVAAQAARRAAESRDRRVKLTRVSEVRKERLAAQARRAQEAEAALARAEQDARLTQRQAAENRRMLKRFARVRQVREARLAAQQLAQRLALEDTQRQRLAAEAAAAERTRAAEEARLVAQRRAQEEGERQRLAAEAAAVEWARAAEATRFAELELQRKAQEAASERARAEEARSEEVRSALQSSHEEAESRAASEAREAADRRLAEAQPPSPVVPPAPPREPAASAPLEGRAGFGREPEWRVTVLMIMTPGNYGIRRGANIADPVLCTIDGCYVSAGADRAAMFFPRRKALGVGNTLGARAGACRQSLSCVFRGVELYYPGALQPVDLHILKHDRRRPQTILADSDCHLGAGRLTCSRGIHAEDYVLWIVPERLAAEAGSEILERALRGGLGSSRSAEVSPRPMR